jgi:hypothetical protein
MTSLDLSFNNLGAEETKIIGEAIKVINCVVIDTVFMSS